MDWAVDIQRIRPSDDTAMSTVEQAKALVGRLGNTGSPPLFDFNACYDPIGLSVNVTDSRV